MTDTTELRIKEANDWYNGRLEVKDLHYCLQCGSSLVHVSEGVQCRSCHFTLNHDKKEDQTL